MNRPLIVTFTSDFGWCGGYVAACEATVTRLCPDARMLHVSHEVPVGDIVAGALVLARVAPLYPVAVHLGVVDPGVGTARRPLVLRAQRGDLLVGPDNGLLVDAAEALGGVSSSWVLDLDMVRGKAGLPPAHVSTTFHGRDVFAPAAALLASGIEVDQLGTEVETDSLVLLPPPVVRVTDSGVAAPVIEVDRFGNVGLALAFADLPVPPGPGQTGATGESFSGEEPARLCVEVSGVGESDWTARVARTYGDLAPGELGLIRDSWGQAALALNGASAAEFLGVRRGEVVTLAPIDAPPRSKAGRIDSGPSGATGFGGSSAS